MVGSSATTAAGIPLTLTLQLVNTNLSCTPLAGYAVYLWHCTREGTYSMYSTGLTGETFLRGVQQADANGQLSFTTIFPGCYDGRYPHMHFEVYPSLAAATTASNAVLTSQLTFPVATLASDNVFGNDSAARQISTATGSASAGYHTHLVVGVAV